MKKILFTLLLSIFILPGIVKADEIIIDLMQTEFTPYSNVSLYKGCIECGAYLADKYIYNDFEKFYSDKDNREIFNNLWNDFYLEVGSIKYISVLILSNSSKELDLFAILITGFADYDYNTILYLDGTYYPYKHSGYGSNPVEYIINGSGFSTWSAMPHFTSANPFVVGTGDFSSTWFYIPTTSFMNDIKYYNQAENTTFNIYNTNSELINTISYASELPSIYEWGEFNPDDVYTEVNLDNYEYVILNLKDYSLKDAFETNLKVKGSIAITPVYEFGTVEKDIITDVCNTSYSDYTNYRFFILKNDLLNNAVYIVKECASSGSSFKFDSELFDITYVTEDNKDDPIITFNGKEYHTIPFDKLSNTVNKNEEEDFVPGESGSSLSGIVNNITNFTSDIWNSISSFMDLVTKFFNTLPEEFRFLSVTAFTVLVTIAIIKFIKS